MEVYLGKTALKQYEKLNEPMLSRVDNALEGLEKEPPAGDIKAMVGRPGIFRLRVGGYRLLFRVETSRVKVFKIARRGQAYKE